MPVFSTKGQWSSLGSGLNNAQPFSGWGVSPPLRRSAIPKGCHG